MIILLNKWEIFYRYGAQKKALYLNAERYILKNKIVEQNDLNKPLWNEQDLYR